MAKKKIVSPPPVGGLLGNVAQTSPNISSALSAYGTDLTPPAPAAAPKVNFTANGVQNLNSVSAAVQQSQDQANAANTQRYGQGLGVLTGGLGAMNQQYQGAQGAIGQAIANSNLLGTTARSRIQENEQNAAGHAQQSAVSRGLNNTTIADTLQRGVERDAERANQDVDEQVANRLSALNLQQAGQFNTQASAQRAGAGDIASFIAARNDVAPNMMDYASLIKSAAEFNPNAKRSAIVTDGSINDPNTATGQGGAASNVRPFNPGASSAGVAGGNSNTYSGNASTSGSTGGAGGGMPGPIQSAVNPTPPGPIQSATSGDGTGGYAFMPNGSSVVPGGYKPGTGSVSVGPSAPTAPQAPDAFSEFDDEEGGQTQTAQAPAPNPCDDPSNGWLRRLTLGCVG